MLTFDAADFLNLAGYLSGNPIGLRKFWRIHAVRCHYGARTLRCDLPSCPKLTQFGGLLGAKCGSFHTGSVHQLLSGKQIWERRTRIDTRHSAVTIQSETLPTMELRGWPGRNKRLYQQLHVVAPAATLQQTLAFEL
jgi:hypothetical protein